MYSMHGRMYKFFDDYVRITKDVKDQLSDYRDRNIQRLETGLKKLGYNSAFTTQMHGSYAMHTMVQRDSVDYDIDIAVIFDRENLPSNALDARKRVCLAMEKSGTIFKKAPEVRPNAVTVWYADGYHVDFPVFRINEFNGKQVIEHAGTKWRHRDPCAINDWFKGAVNAQSPRKEYGATIEDKQMQRIVRYLKTFAKSRESWDLPGGLLISVLVAECYISDSQSDDVSLYHTMQRIKQRLDGNRIIFNPTLPYQSKYQLTDTFKNQKRVERFRDKLAEALRSLSPLLRYGCDSEMACQAWSDVFNHEYWYKLCEGEQMRRGAIKSETYITPEGFVYVGDPGQEIRSYHSPKHEFYGDDE